MLKDSRVPTPCFLLPAPASRSSPSFFRKTLPKLLSNYARLARITRMGESTTRFPRYYALYFKDDSEKTEVAIGDSIAEILADGQACTGRPFLDFQFREIGKTEFESFNLLPEN